MSLFRTPVRWRMLMIAAPVASFVTAALAVLAGPVIFAQLLGVASGVGLLTRPMGRLAFTVFGGLVFLQGTNDVGKQLYLLAVLGCYGIALSRLPKSFAQRPDLRVFRPMLTASAVWSLYLLAMFFVSHGHGTPTSDYLRDVAPYLLLAVLPTVAIDAAKSARERHFTLVILTAGIVASIALVITWLARRRTGVFSVDNFAFASYPLAIITLCYCLSRVPNRRVGFLWAVFCMLIYTCILITGSRGALLLAVVFVGLVGARRKARLPLNRFAATVLAVVAGVIVLLPIASGKLLRDPDYLKTRFASVQSTLTGTGSLSTDQSLRLRQEQTRAAYATWHEYPLLGSGPGYRYELSSRAFTDTFNLDTPIVTPAKIGAVGTLLLLIYVARIFLSIRAHRRLVGYSSAITCARLYGLSVLVSVPLGSAAEDKGTALALMLLIANVAMRHPLTPEFQGVGPSPAHPPPAPTLPGRFHQQP